MANTKKKVKKKGSEDKKSFPDKLKNKTLEGTEEVVDALKQTTEFILKPAHSLEFLKLLMQLNKLGVDVSMHAMSLGVEKKKLEKIKQEKTFIDKSDSKKLHKFLDEIMSASGSLLRLETILYRNTKPVVLNALGKIAPLSEKMFSIYGLRYLFVDRKSPKTMKEAHNILLATFKLEENLFKEYPELLKKIENAVEEIVKLENKWKGKGGQSHLDMFRMHLRIRKMLREDVHNLSDQIYKMYKLKLKTYEYLIEIDEKNKKRIIPELEKEYYKTVKIQERYIKTTREHMERLNKIYGVRIK